MKNAVFWDVAPCRYGVNRRFGGTSLYTIYSRRHIPEDGIFHDKSSSGISHFSVGNRGKYSRFAEEEFSGPSFVVRAYVNSSV
jgi:hypothetical protein